MRPERNFIAERALASHCSELLRKGLGPEDLLPALNRLGERLARRLSGALAPLLGDEAPQISATPAREGDLEGFRQSVDRLAANSLFSIGTAAHPLLVSIEAEPVLRIVDRTFGGKGEAPRPMPATFPMAAELMVARLETLMARHVGAAIVALQETANGDLPALQGESPPVISPLRRDGSLASLAPYPGKLPLAVLTLEVDDGSVLPWLIKLAMPFATLANLFGLPEPTLPDAVPAATGGAASAGALPGLYGPRPREHELASAAEAPFNDIPLPVRAVLVEMNLSFAQIADLAVGQVLPLPAARRVPLRVGEQTIAEGTVGSVDDRVAVRVVQAFTQGKQL